jgi:hypothetical protein
MNQSNEANRMNESCKNIPTVHGFQEVAGISLNWGLLWKHSSQPARYSIHEVPGQLATVRQHASKAQMTELQNTELQNTELQTTELQTTELQAKRLNYRSNDWTTGQMTERITGQITELQFKWLNCN